MEKGEGRQTDGFHVLAHSPSTCSGQGWAGLRPGARSFIWSHMGGRVAVFEAISRELGWKWDGGVGDGGFSGYATMLAFNCLLSKLPVP